MSSPPKEKIETKGGHLPAGKAPCAVVLGVFFFKPVMNLKAFCLCNVSDQKKERKDHMMVMINTYATLTLADALDYKSSVVSRLRLE